MGGISRASGSLGTGRASGSECGTAEGYRLVFRSRILTWPAPLQTMRLVRYPGLPVTGESPRFPPGKCQRCGSTAQRNKKFCRPCQKRDAEPISTAPDSYREYIGGSATWQAKRETRLALDDYRCAKCQSRRNLHVHHCTYARFGHELMEDLITLCVRCHAAVHKRARKHPDVSLDIVTSMFLGKTSKASKREQAMKMKRRRLPRHWN